MSTLRSLVAASGTAEVRARPDRATLSLGVRATSLVSTTEAASAVVLLERKVLAALERLSIARDHVVTALFDTGRERLYEHKQWRDGMFYVDHHYEVELHDVERVGAVIAAVRAAGASRIAGVHFWLSDEEAVQIRATREAIVRARSRAEAMADAAGATLGCLVRLGTPEALVTTLGGGDAGGRSMIALSDARGELASGLSNEAESIVLPGAISVSATIHAAWEAIAAA
jgi:uncharacterized protein YggE